MQTSAALTVGTVALLMLLVYEIPAGNTLLFVATCALFGFVWLFMLPFQIGLAFCVDPSGRVAGQLPAAQLLGSALGPLVASFTVHGEDVTPVPLVSAGFAIGTGLLLLIMRLGGATRPRDADRARGR